MGRRGCMCRIYVYKSHLISIVSSDVTQHHGERHSRPEHNTHLLLDLEQILQSSLQRRLVPQRPHILHMVRRPRIPHAYLLPFIVRRTSRASSQQCTSHSVGRRCPFLPGCSAGGGRGSREGFRWDGRCGGRCGGR